MKRAFLLVALIVSPNIVFGDGYNIGELKKQILDAKNPVEASKLLTDLSNQVHNAHTTAKGELKKSLETKVTDAITAYNAEVKSTDARTKEQKEADLEKKQQAYEDAKANEQSTANKTLTAATTAAMGIGAMELLQGRAEQKADKEADAAMDALIATMRCTYAEGKQVKAGPDEIELPGGNNSELMKYRAEYMALAADLKERKTALGMKAGIESEEIFDKATIGLYDDENTGMTSGAYESLYRAKMLGSETDQKKIDDMASTSKKRVVGGAIAAGAGALVGVVGNSLINGKLGEKIKEGIANKKVGKETQALLKKEADALDDLRECLKDAGVQETDKLTFSEFYPSVLSVKGLKCNVLDTWKNPKATGLFNDSTEARNVLDTLIVSFGWELSGKMIGYTKLTESTKNTETNNAVEHLKKSIEAVQKKFKDAEEADKAAAEKAGISIGNITGSADGDGIFSLSSLFNGGDKYSGYFPQPTATPTE